MAKRVLAGALILAAGVGLGFAVPKRWFNRDGMLSRVYAIRPPDSSGKYKFISPLLLYDFSEQSQFSEYRALKESLNSLVDRKIATHSAEKISVYFRDLSNGQWVGINQNDIYAPASLLKVPIMIAFFKQAVTNPEILQKKITYELFGAASSDTQTSILKPGRLYSIQELIEYMIINSDNTAKDLLLRLVDKSSLDEVFTDLGVQVSPGTAEPYAISAKTYSLFFRILRNATFLNRQLSEQALDILSRTTFNDGLVAGLPPQTMATHKYGFHSLANGKMELHDCGIVYRPPGPYLLCVMTRGHNAENLKTTIKDISQLVFEKIKS